jgi:hypothetical protein
MAYSSLRLWAVFSQLHPLMSHRATPNRGVRALLALAFPIALIVCTPLALAQMRALTLPQNIADLVNQSHVVLQGWVTEVKLQSHPTLRNLVMVAVTVQVEDTFKGPVSRSYTFHQAVIDPRDQQNKLGYRAGEHVVLFLIKPNSNGLSSPAGLEQGKFRIAPGPRGALVVSNGLGNVGLFSELPSRIGQDSRLSTPTRSLLAKPSPGPLDLQQLKNIVRTVASQGGT